MAHGRYIEDEDGNTVATIWGDGKAVHGTAKLFAAAPDLLAALKELAATYGIGPEYPITEEPGNEGHNRMARAIRAAHVAIAKASGESGQ